MPAMSKSKGFLNVVTVGDAKTGKSSLLSVLKDGKVPNTDVPGIFDTFSLHMKVDGRKVEIGLWDTPGEDDYAALRRLSYPNCDVFVVCYSVASRRSFQHVKTKWLPEVQKYGPLTPIIIVATKLDMRPRTSLKRSGSQGSTNGVKQPPVPVERFVKFDEGMELANEAGAYAFLECSAKDDSGVKEVFENAIRASFKNEKENKAKGKGERRGSGLLGMLKK